jgi:hypothetical protein
MAVFFGKVFYALRHSSAHARIEPSVLKHSSEATLLPLYRRRSLRGVAQPGSASVLGAESPRFKSGRPDAPSPRGEGKAGMRHYQPDHALVVVKSYDIKALKVGWAKHHAFGKGLTAMGLDKTFGFRPGQKCFF